MVYVDRLVRQQGDEARSVTTLRSLVQFVQRASRPLLRREPGPTFLLLPNLLVFGGDLVYLLAAAAEWVDCLPQK